MSVKGRGAPGGCPLTVIILTDNETAHIVPCLRAAQWADNRLVIHSGSDDDIPALAAAHGARVLSRPFTNWPEQRNYALDQATTDWVLFVDVDERVTLDLARAVQAVLAAAQETTCVGYWIPRQNVILGRWVRHAGWYPDYQLRLFRRSCGRYDPARPVHELVQLSGEAGRLTPPLVHLNYSSWGQFWAKQRRYARLEAERLQGEGIRPKPHSLILQPLRELRRRYWELHGHREGLLGLQLSLALSWFTFVTYYHLWQLSRRRTPRVHGDAPPR